MAFGFPSSYSQYQSLNKITKLHYFFIAVETIKKLNWKLIEINETELIAESQNNSNTWNEQIHIDLKSEDALITSISNGNQIYDHGRNKKNVDFFLDLFYDVKKEKSVADESENYFQECITSEKKAVQLNTLEEKKIISFYSFFSIFIPAKDYIITPILININILYFLIMCFSGVNPFYPEINDIIDWGGNYGPLTIENNWWRIISACFVHIGILHLLMNCFALGYAGLLLEPYLKKWGFLTTYLLAGVIASLSSLYWNNDLVSAGASGAIFGMYGILLPLLLFKIIDKKINTNLLSSLVLFIVINIMGSFKEGIDGAAHIGGLSFGIIGGLTLVVLSEKRKIALAAVTTFAILLSAIFITVCKDKKIYIYQIAEYETGMKDFTEMEKLALESYRDYSDSKEHILYMIKERGIYYWEENIVLLKNLERLSLPETLHDQNKNLIEYCNLRIKSYNLSYKKINENNNDYDNDIDDINSQIEKLIILIKNNSEKQSQ
ncbi:rhomboid family intramembrane serine protease [Flavobacterium aquicola]|uniref:Rhomboid protease GluP n=1 Tax=Flavobacterium aquicola TaxID=1682742 RepID=A0A3E0EV07_9FLAO|nr:rhomboid family intramembrane serine protease [Flavobacterium aquicola]REH01998.1 rhomboid protease GluP [Flavobacterium aquicola]